jgi:hypothetical protein
MSTVANAKFTAKTLRDIWRCCSWFKIGTGTGMMV